MKVAILFVVTLFSISAFALQPKISETTRCLDRSGTPISDHPICIDTEELKTDLYNVYHLIESMQMLNAMDKILDIIARLDECN